MGESGEIIGEELSASSTLLYFDPPIPLLRGSIPAGLSDDPPSGPFVLAFGDTNSWKSALGSCQSKIRQQCEDGFRIGCSISASSKCKPPWWTSLFGRAIKDFPRREQCEEREMSACLAACQDSCFKFSNDKCSTPFGDARIASSSFDHGEASKYFSKGNLEVSYGMGEGDSVCGDNISIVKTPEELLRGFELNEEDDSSHGENM